MIRGFHTELEAVYEEKNMSLTEDLSKCLEAIDVIYSYLDLQDLGLSEDRNKAIFEQIQALTLDDVKAFQQKWVKDRKYILRLSGRPERLRHGLPEDPRSSTDPYPRRSLWLLG